MEIIQELCWARNIQDLSNSWQQQYHQPEFPSTALSVLHYNIRYFYSNQSDLIDMVNVYYPSIVSINELGTVVPNKIIKQLLFSYNVYTKEGTNPHGGVVLAIDKRLKCELMDINEPNIIAVQVTIEQQHFVVASIYSPPTDQLPLSTMSILLEKSKNVIIVGDLNAKHGDWGCPQMNKKGRNLTDWLSKHHLNVLNAGIKTSLRSNTTIDLIISTEVPETTDSQSLPYTSSDHLPILTKFFRLNVSDSKLVVPRTYWKLYSNILNVLHDQLQAERENSMNECNNTYSWFLCFQQFLAALKLRVTEWKEVKRKRPSIPKSLRILLHHKHYLQNRFRHKRQEEDRLRLRSWNILIKQEFRTHRQRTWEQFISNVASPNPTTFWSTVKKLNKKKSVDFTAITDESIIHRSPEDIVKNLAQHFTERHARPELNMSNTTDREANELWQLYSAADQDDIRLISKQSDLRFNEQDIKNVIQSLKNKNSSGFDQVSNKMIKGLPTHFHAMLTQAYNELFSSAYWGSEWKIARTICLNKSDNPAPTTSQLRPISMLPVFSKIYEKLFLLRFNNWSTKMNVLPAQQSGSRPHQATTSRVNCLLEQITQSLRYNTFTPVVYIDFMQAFDKLWQQGLVLKLNKLNCPSAYLAWIVNYFTGRSLKVDYGGIESILINIERGAPQGSCLGPVMYVINHHDLPQIFSNPMNVHAYVDDIAIVYSPSMHLKFKYQVIDIEKHINNDMQNLMEYANEWHQPLNPKKTELVNYHRAVQSPKLNVYYDGVKIIQSKSFKYLGFYLDAKLSFRIMIDAQFIKLRKAYAILKFIHRQFPSFLKLKIKFFNTYVWPHLYMLSTIYCLFSITSRERIAAFYRRCLRLIYCLFQCPTEDLHEHFKLPTIEHRFKKCLSKRMKSIQRYEPIFIDSVLQNKHLFNMLYHHYRIKANIRNMPAGRPSNRISAFLNTDCSTFFDQLCQFVSS
ncbi:unnamed protein product [Rotaria magnacalcarata]|nr:unnamed protein product [Rotaria magnacalcarata]